MTGNKEQSELIEIKDATHFCMMEKNRTVFYDNVKTFLNKHV